MKIFLPLTVFLLIAHLGTIAQADCRSSQYKEDLIRNTPGLAIRLQEIESFTRRQLQRPSVAVTGIDHGTSQGNNNVITIPVVVHVLYNSSNQNITDAQVRSQIDVLNRDYRKLNPDTLQIPAYFSSLAADCGIRFELARVDQNGYATTGIIHKHTNVQAFSVNDAIKLTSKGGDDAWDRDSYLNIWVGNLSQGILGYASPVGCTKGTDGVTIRFTAFGTMGTAFAPFNLGRTATHEIGHWLNLIHIWGDASCGNDQVDDTPQQQNSSSGNPSGIIVSCGNGSYGNMYMNYMDFTDDIGMHMFTSGQRSRMQALFAEGGFRRPLLSSTALTAVAIPNPNPPEPDPTASGDGENGAGFHIYPNPVINTVSVTITEPSHAGSLLEIYNLTGQKVLSFRITANLFQEDLSQLSRGIYFARINDGTKRDGFKLVKL
ncbi:T9SS type A sorting domain-containing protein [Flavitalea flava]